MTGILNILKRKFRVLAAALAAATVISSVPVFTAEAAVVYKDTPATFLLGDEIINSDYALLVDTVTGNVLCWKRANERMYPASMTKVMTILTASDYISDLTDTVEITQDIIDYAKEKDCTRVGFEAGEMPTVKDLLTGTILCSGADAAIALGRYIGGSDEGFVELMNKKAQQLGLENTHFTNCVGLFDEQHYSTAAEIAAIMQAAVVVPVCFEALSAKKYTTAQTPEHPEGITIKSLFLERMAGQTMSGLCVCGKTGFVKQSDYCAVSYYASPSGNPYICVTGHADTSLLAVSDHAVMYMIFTR